MIQSQYILLASGNTVSIQFVAEQIEWSQAGVKANARSR